ncbi:hypothetical protein AB0M20_10950 [Actinoplanes sp. NPDC051633]|uniref:hypothetical protein n=1 Tax=Actinoplanes sp. NPDC051633 TaxID=3155670 RepID=UPI00343E8A28
MQKVDLPPVFAVFAFVIFESQLAVAMMPPSKQGRAGWLIAVVMGCIAPRPATASSRCSHGCGSCW